MSPDRRKRLFLVSVCLGAYGLGIITAWNELFPFPVVRDAAAAARAYLEVYGPQQRLIDRELTRPSIRRPLPADDGQHILVAGGMNFLPDESTTGHTLAWIMDRAGTIQHVWEYDPAIWNGLQKVHAAPLKSEVYPVGLHLYADGSLLASFQGKHCWPYAVGLAKFDKDSRLLWKQELLTHHWFSVGDDGRIYAAAMRIIDSPLSLGGSEVEIISPDGRITEDVILILDRDGNVLDEIPMLKALADGGWLGLFQGATEEPARVRTGDPTHLNDVRVVSAQEAAAHELLEPGDLLVSFRSLNAIGILDPTSRTFKWMSVGSTVRQHSPRIVGDGVLVFDNRGGPVTAGGSRLVSLGFDTPQPRTVFPRAQQSDLKHPFYTDVAGHLDIGSNGRVLVTLTCRSEIWEVDASTGEVLWEYVFVSPASRERRPLYTAKYVRDVGFQFNRRQQETP
jgi:hypothetical protein